MLIVSYEIWFLIIEEYLLDLNYMYLEIMKNGDCFV